MFKNKVVLVTGAAGTVGKELVKQLLVNNVAEVRAIDNNESEVFFLEQNFLEYIKDKSFDADFYAYIGDVRDFKSIDSHMRGVDIVFHVAALKHVILCEKAPFDATQTNIMGVKNVVDAAIHNNVEKVIFTSSDKAVNPTNVMGTSKLMGEKLVTAANSLNNHGRTIFSSTRFGNVIGSRGSVIPIFYNQIKSGNPITLTDPEMTRFIMTIFQSVNLIIKAAEMAKGGEVFVTKMPVVNIKDLAEVMIEHLAQKFGYDITDIPINVIGVKPGEKLYEELMSSEETGRALELEEQFAILPAFRSVYKEINYKYPGFISERVTNPYVSADENKMSKLEIKDYLIKNKIFENL